MATFRRSSIHLSAFRDKPVRKPKRPRAPTDENVRPADCVWPIVGPAPAPNVTAPATTVEVNWGDPIHPPLHVPFNGSPSRSVTPEPEAEVEITHESPGPTQATLDDTITESQIPDSINSPTDTEDTETTTDLSDDEGHFPVVIWIPAVMDDHIQNSMPYTPETASTDELYADDLPEGAWIAGLEDDLEDAAAYQVPQDDLAWDADTVDEVETPSEDELSADARSEDPFTVFGPLAEAYRRLDNRIWGPEAHDEEGRWVPGKRRAEDDDDDFPIKRARPDPVEEGGDASSGGSGSALSAVDRATLWDFRVSGPGAYVEDGESDEGYGDSDEEDYGDSDEEDYTESDEEAYGEDKPQDRAQGGENSLVDDDVQAEGQQEHLDEKVDEEVAGDAEEGDKDVEEEDADVQGHDEQHLSANEED